MYSQRYDSVAPEQSELLVSVYSFSGMFDAKNNVLPKKMLFAATTSKHGFSKLICQLE